MAGSGDHVTVRDLLNRARVSELTDPVGSRALVQQARSIAHASGDPEGEAEALYRLASLSFHAGRSDEAFTIAVEARDLALAHGAHLVVAWALNLLGIVHLGAGNYSEALQCCLQSLERYRMTGQTGDEGNYLNTMASVYHALGDTDRAIVTHEESLSVNRQLDRPEFDAITLANMASLRAERGEYLLAVSLGEQALALAREHAESFIPQILTILGEAYVGIGDPEQGTELLQKALELLSPDADAEDDPTPAERTAVLLALGGARVACDDRDTAIALFEEGLGLATAHGLRAMELSLHTALAEVLKHEGRYQDAVSHLEARFELNQRLFNEGTDLRIRTLQIAYDTEQARQQAEILRLRTTELQQLVDGRTSAIEDFQLQLLERIVHLGRGESDRQRSSDADVGDLAAELALELQMPEAWCQQLRLAARLRDVGEIASARTDARHDASPQPQHHALMGADLLEGSSSPVVQLAAEVARFHHEHWNGAGAPQGLSGAQIPASGRVVAVAEAYLDRLAGAAAQGVSAPGAAGITPALAAIVEHSGTAFDPDVVGALLNVVERQHPGITAALRDTVC